MAEDDFVSGKGEDTPRAGTYAIYKDGGDLLVEVIATADEARCVAQEIADDEGGGGVHRHAQGGD